MKILYLFFICFVLIFSSADSTFSQYYCVPGRFDTSYYFSPLQLDTIGPVSFGQNIDWLGNPLILTYTIAFPRMSEDPLPMRPFILLIHGGGFIDGDKYDMKPVMLDFALKGYVCASIDYRIGWNTNGNPFNCSGDGYSLAKAVYRALQDCKAAFRYFAANADLYHIDTAFMFSAGISAGAVSSLMIAFAKQENINLVYPGLVTELGPLNSATNGYTIPFRIKSVISSSGGMFDTSYITYSKFIRSSNAVPVLMFHGTADIEVPYATGFAYACANYVRTEGSSDITKRLRNLSMAFELDYVPGGGHENFYPLPYIQLRTGLFLKRILCGQWRQIIIENYTTIFDTTLGIITGGIAKIEPSEKNYNLKQNYPNPFNPETKISYNLSQPGLVQLKVYDLLGKEIKTLVNENKASGSHIVYFNAVDLAGGVYFYRLQINGFSTVKRMIYIK